MVFALLPFQISIASIEEIDNSTMAAVADDLKAVLERSRFKTEEGSFLFTDPKFCEEIVEENKGGNCFGQNPLSPYGVISLPESANIVHPEAVKPLYEKAPEGEQLIWHLDSTDAIVMLGLTPPEHRYYSFTPYVMSRYKPLNNSRLFNFLVDLTPARLIFGTSINEGHRDTFSSVIPAINNKNIISEPTNSDMHNLEYTAIIMSADANMIETVEDELRQVLDTHNISANIVNTLPLPSNKLHLGDKSRDDTFTILTRTAFLVNPEDRELMNAYTNNPPMEVMRVSGKPFQRHVPAETVPFPPRAQGWKENYVKEDLQKLVKEVKAYFLNYGYTLKSESRAITATSRLIEGVHGLKLGYGTLGDSPDAVYMSAPFFQLKNPDSLVAYIGINHAEITNPDNPTQSKSEYSSLTTYILDNVGALSAISDQELIGTALPFAEGIGTSSSEESLYSRVFYVGILANDCSQHDLPNCRNIGSLQDIGYSPGDIILTIERTYLRADGDTQNEYGELLPATQLLFERPTR